MIGIDISDQTIKVVQLSSPPKRRLLSHCMKQLPLGVIENGVVIDKKKMEEEIRAALTSCRIPVKIKDSVVASIPETQSFLRVIEIPIMDEDEIHEAVRWEIAQHIPFGLENVYVDWQHSASRNHGAKPGHMEVEVGAAQKRVVDPLYEVMKSIGLDVVAYELESQAIVRSLISNDWKLKQGILIIDLGSTATNVVVYDYGAVRFTASLPYGVVQLLKDVSAQDARAIMENLEALPKELSDRVEPKIAHLADALVKDIFGIVKFYNGIDAKHEVREIILTGGGSNLPGLDGVFLKYFLEVNIQRGNPWVNILSGKDAVRPPLDIQESVRYSTAIGLAIRSIIPL
ncbi:MAG TPA: type IV pilus assembly protein PilM [Candidatus Andersenbacteria bacterium]|nr:type IV pilus assembly protein PilM [Candidatus Andersenbacteria bacterium]